MTKAQEVYERVEALVASGVRKADAFRQAAEEFGQPFNSMRGAYYAHTRTLSDTPSRPRKRQTATLDPIESATLVLTDALAAIDDQVAAAKTRAETAKAEYEQLRDTASERKGSIKSKIDALNS
jgi:hypothetical protein